MNGEDLNALDNLQRAIVVAEKKGVNIFYGFNGRDEIFHLSTDDEKIYFPLMKSKASTLIMVRKRLEGYIDAVNTV